MLSNGNQVGSALSQTLQESSKAGGSSGVVASASSPASHPPPRPEFAAPARVVSENDNFRSNSRTLNAPREAFEGMTIDQFLQSEPESQGHLFHGGQHLGKGKKPIYTTYNEDSTGQNFGPEFTSAWQPRDEEKNSQGHECDSLHDGDDVVKLLADPNFQPEFWPEEDPEEPYTITREEMQISQWFAQKTQEGGPRRERILQAVAAARGGQAFPDFASIFDEIESYHEDVWGYIGPLVEAARQEQDVTKSVTTRDGPAVHRLRMIVAHLQAPALSNPTKPLS